LLVAAAFVAAPANAADADLVKALDRPIAEVRKASEDALATLGVLKLKKSEPELLEGQRSRKVGAFVGSGGEILTVMLKSLDANRTEVTVKNKKTFVGMAGQKNWSEPLMAEIEKLLTPAAPAATLAEATPAAPATPDAPAAPQTPAEPAQAPSNSH
jgi:hypothetical protein